MALQDGLHNAIFAAGKVRQAKNAAAFSLKNRVRAGKTFVYFLRKKVYIIPTSSALLCVRYEKLTKTGGDICQQFHLKDSGWSAIITLAVCLHFVLSLFMNSVKTYHEIFASNREDGV